MVKTEKVLTVIPARGGSKGIPHKNILDFAGYPLIAYSIAAAQQAKLVTRVIVSTDDEEIARVARLYGADVPFMRPDELAEDNSPDLPLFEHALAWLRENEGYQPDVLVQLRPTSPIRPPTIVDDAINLLLNNPQASCVRGVVPSGQNPHKMWKIDPETKKMIPLLTVEGLEEPYNAPRQILPDVFWQTGHIDAIRQSTILEQHSLTGNHILPLIIDKAYTVDIDSMSDWQKYETLVYEGKLEMVQPGKKRRPLPDDIHLVVFDFDGVFTDNRVWVDADGRELIAAYRSDSIGVKILRECGIEAVVISSEVDNVVKARCDKMKLPVIHGVEEKGTVFTQYLKTRQIDPANTIYVGNDVNDLPCFPLAAYAVAVADAQPEVLRQADYVLKRPGGHGSVRELCDLIISKTKL